MKGKGKAGKFEQFAKGKGKEEEASNGREAEGVESKGNAGKGKSKDSSWSSNVLTWHFQISD